jgi:cell division protein FtsN
VARDYRHRSRRSRRSRASSPPWVWSLAGLLVGLFVAFLVYLQMRPGVVLVTETAVDTRAAAAKPPAAEANKSPARAPKGPRFDFYNLLPEMEVIVQEREIKGEPTPAGVRRVEEPGTYLLQAGSFRHFEQADQLRAKLAMLGLETRVQTVSIDNRQTWHRVRVGPFSNLTDLNGARAMLKENGIDAILIRLKG